MPHQCSLRRIAIVMVAGTFAVSLIVVLFTSQLLQKHNSPAIVKVAAVTPSLHRSELQRQFQKQNFPTIVKAAAVAPGLHPSELQPQLQEQHARVPRAMLSSETLKFQQKCWSAKYSNSGKTPFDHTPLPFLPASSATSTPSCQGDIFLLVMVQTAINHRDRRDLIRRTWASVTNIKGDRLTTIFFVGRSKNSAENVALRNEIKSQADIVQADFVDDYRNLTYKHLYALKWIGERCESVRYVMKIDDDSMPNVFQLRLALRERLASVKGNFFYCQTQQAPPIRDSNSKWGVTIEEWPDNIYPNYCLGFGYVLTGDLVAQLHHCAKWRRFFRIDDVFVSGALASALGAPRIRWKDGWAVKVMHPRLAGPEAAQSVLVYEETNSVLPTLYMRIWRAMVRYSGEFDNEL